MAVGYSDITSKTPLKPLLPVESAAKPATINLPQLPVPPTTTPATPDQLQPLQLPIMEPHPVPSQPPKIRNAVAANLGHQAQPVKLESTDNQVWTVNQVKMVNPVKMLHQDKRLLHVFVNAHQVHLAQLDHPETKVQRDTQENKESLVPLVSQDQRVQSVNKAQLVHLAFQVAQEIRESQVNMYQALLHQAHQEDKEKWDHLAHQVHPAAKVKLESPVHKDQKEIKVIQAHTENQEHPDHLVQPVAVERWALVITVPSHALHPDIKELAHPKWLATLIFISYPSKMQY